MKPNPTTCCRNFLEIWDRASSYSPEKGKALGWIITLSRRRAIDRLREREAYCRAEERLAEETKRHPQDWIAHVEEDIAHREMREHLPAFLADCPRRSARRSFSHITKE